MIPASDVGEGHRNPQPVGEPVGDEPGAWAAGHGPRRWHLCHRQDDQPRAFASPPDSRSPSTVGAPVGPRRRECTVPLAPSFTANNRWEPRSGPSHLKPWGVGGTLHLSYLSRTCVLQNERTSGETSD